MIKVTMKFMIMIIFISFIPYISLANEYEDMITTHISGIVVKEDVISGSINITNNSDNYLPEVSYVINLLINETISGEDSATSINNSQAILTELAPKEEKVFLFEHKIPKGLPKSEVYLYLRVSAKNIIESSWKQILYIGEIGKGDEYLRLNEKTNKLLSSAAKVSNITLYPKLNEKYESKLSLYSTFRKEITAVPKLKIYAPNLLNSKQIISSEGQPVTFAPGKDTEFKLEIPPLNDVGQYLIKVAMFDGEIQISEEMELSCFVNGKVASIANSMVSLSENKNNAIVKTLFLGNRINTKSEKYDLNYKVYNKDANTLIKEESKKISLNDMTTADELIIQNIGEESILLEISILNGNELLATHSIEFNRDKLTPVSSKVLPDVTSEAHRSAIIALVQKGFVSGYPDGSFKPEKNITRAEFTVIANRLAESKLFSENSLFNDVTEDHWAKDFINTAYKNKYLSGYGNGLFKPENNVTYQEAITILVNVIGYPNLYTEQSDAKDFYNSEWPDNYIGAAVKLNLLNDLDVTDLSQPATRQDIALLTLNAYFNK